MNWVAETKKLKLDDLAVFSKTGQVALIKPRTNIGVRGSNGFVTGTTTHMSDIFLVETSGREFAVEATANNIARDGHHLTVFYLGKVGTGSGHSIAYYNHEMDKLVYDYELSGSDSGEYRPDLQGPPLAEGCLSLILGVVGLIVFNNIFGIEDLITPLIFFVICVILGFVILRNYAFQGPRKRVERVQSLVRSELAKVQEIRA